MRRITLVNSNDFPAAHFTLTHQQLIGLVPDLELRIHHIGSTSIPGILSKPLLDVLLVIEDGALTRLDAASSRFTALGYEVMGEFGISGRRYYRKLDEDDAHLVHIHAFEKLSPHTTRHLAFRDFLRIHTKRAQMYSDLKRELVLAHDAEREAYMNGKHDFITHTDELAAQWIDHATIDLEHLAATYRALAALLDEEVVLADDAIAAHLHELFVHPGGRQLDACYNDGILTYREFIDAVCARVCTFVQNEVGAARIPVMQTRVLETELLQGVFAPMREWV